MTILILRLDVPMGRGVGSSMIKNAPTLNGRAAVFALLAIALVIVAPIGRGWAEGAKPELTTFTSGDLALKGFIWKPEGPGPFPAILWNHGSEKQPAPSIRSLPILLVGVTFSLRPAAEVRGSHPAPTSWIS